MKSAQFMKNIIRRWAQDAVVIQVGVSFNKLQSILSTDTNAAPAPANDDDNVVASGARGAQNDSI